MVGSALLISLMVIGVAAAIGWPLRPGAVAPPGGGAVDLERRDVEDSLERSLTAIREIEFDHSAGHLSDEDFAALQTAEQARALDLLRRRDAGSEGAAS